jgi:hypothetical protein
MWLNPRVYSYHFVWSFFFPFPEAGHRLLRGLDFLFTSSCKMTDVIDVNDCVTQLLFKG